MRVPRSCVSTMCPRQSTSSVCEQHWRANGPSIRGCACPTNCGESAPRRRAATLPHSIQPSRKGKLMSVLDPRELQASPLADLHALASELGLEGYRRLRKDDLITQIIKAGGGT